MADLPLFPTEENKDTLQAYINLQRDLEAILLKQAKSYENIGYISLKLEKNAQARNKFERDRINDNLKDLSNLQKDILAFDAIKGNTERTNALHAMAANKERMANNIKEIQLVQQLGELEVRFAKRRYEEDHAWGNFISNIGKEHFGIKNDEYTLTKSINKELEKYPLTAGKYAGVLAVVIVMLKGAYDLFLSFDKAAWKFRETMGMTREDMVGIRKTTEKLAINYAHIGVTITSAYKAVSALGEQMGSVFTVSEDLVKNVAIMSAQLGVSEKTSAAFLSSMAGVSQSTMQAQQDTMYMAANMSRAAGVPLDAVMKDVANRSTQTLTMMSRVPNVILRTAIEARRLNTTIGDMAKASRSILDFQESVNNEMDASVLLGRSINLQRARELAYRRDLEGSTKEILRITKSIDFENLDVFQQEAYAKATGRTVDELLKMVVAERQWEKARRDPTLKGKVEAYEKLHKLNEATAKANAKNYALDLQRRANQERIVAITNKWNQIMMKAQSALLPLVDKLLSIIPPLLDFLPIMMGLSKSISGILILTGKWIEALAKAQIFNIGNILHVKKISFFMTQVYGISSKFFTTLLNIGKSFGFLGKYIGTFARVLGPIGWIITAFQAISGFMKGWGEGIGLWDKIGKSILGALRAVIPGFDWIVEKVKIVWDFIGPIGRAIFLLTNPIGWVIIGVKELINLFSNLGQAIIHPFDYAKSRLKAWFGSSPSEIGLSIVKGITSVAASIYDALITPFRKGLAWIADKIPGMSKFVNKLQGGINGLMDPIEKRVSATYAPVVTITPEGTKIGVPRVEQPKISTDAETIGTANEKILQNILEAINILNKNLESGKIGFYVDGQLLSATLSRQTDFRGGFGTNNI